MYYFIQTSFAGAKGYRFQLVAEETYKMLKDYEKSSDNLIVSDICSGDIDIDDNIIKSIMYKAIEGYYNG
jgi:hypothetical protein